MTEHLRRRPDGATRRARTLWGIVATLALGCADPPRDASGDVPGDAPVVYEASYASDFNNTRLVIQPGSAAELRPVVPREMPAPDGTVTFGYAVRCPDFLGCETLQHEIAQAIDAWSRPGRLAFRPAPWAEADFHIAFEDAEHGFECDQGFTHGSGTLAHAFTAGCQTGEIHLNADLQWSLSGTRRSADGAVRYDVRTVMIHEIGHLLGLEHHDDALDVMHPAYNGSKRRVSDQTAERALRSVHGEDE